MSEAAILEVVRKNFDDHFILGEEGGIIGYTLFLYTFLGNNSYMARKGFFFSCVENVGVGPIEEMMIDRHKMVWSQARGFTNRDSMPVFRVFVCMSFVFLFFFLLVII